MISAGAAAAGLALYANEPGRHDLEVTHRTIFLRNLPASFDGYRVVQFSDIHLEEYTEDFFLRKVVAQTNALNLVLVTGDFISRGPMPLAVSLEAAARCAELLANLTCPTRYGVFGNHDAIVGPRIIRDHLEANGLPLLTDQSVRLERNGEYIILVGLNDLWFKPNLFRAVPPSPDAPVILMVHEPDFAREIAAHPRGKYVDLILAGHTHGGQVRIPGLRPLALPPQGKLYPEGHFVVGTSQLYVNRGIGTVGVPFRLNCRPEITEFTLRPQPGKQAAT
jgi:predicted MPP superfamily phosphohydrolase